MNYIVLFVCLIFSIELKAEWVMEKNAALDLCNEYLAYLNRKPVDYYFQGMKPDPEFKGLTFPKMTPVDFEDYKQVLKKRLSLSKNPQKLSWEAIVESFKLGKAKYFTYLADVNNDQDLEHVFGFSRDLYDGEYRFYGGYIIDEKNNLLDMGEEQVYKFMNAVTGQAFYFFRDFHLANFSMNMIELYEPYLPWNKSYGINRGNAICVFQGNIFNGSEK